MNLSKLEPTMSVLRLRSLLTMFRGSPPAGPVDEEEVSLGEAAGIWLAAYLKARSPIGQEPLDAMLAAFVVQIVQAGNDAAAEDARPAMLLIADGTFAAISGRPGYIDLRTGEPVAGPKRKPLEIVYYDLTEVVKFHLERLGKEAEHAAAKHTVVE